MVVLHNWHLAFSPCHGLSRWNPLLISGIIARPKPECRVCNEEGTLLGLSSEVVSRIPGKKYKSWRCRAISGVHELRITQQCTEVVYLVDFPIYISEMDTTPNSRPCPFHSMQVWSACTGISLIAYDLNKSKLNYSPRNRNILMNHGSPATSLVRISM
jgi:hypothetical protein